MSDTTIVTSLAIAPLLILAFWWATGLLRSASWGSLALMAGWWGILAVVQIALHAPWYAFPDGVAAAVFGHASWDAWRRGRKPRSERAAGRVVDLGHRLAVVTGGKP